MYEYLISIIYITVQYFSWIFTSCSLGKKDIGEGAWWHQETVSGQRQEVTAELTSLRRQKLVKSTTTNWWKNRPGGCITFTTWHLVNQTLTWRRLTYSLNTGVDVRHSSWTWVLLDLTCLRCSNDPTWVQTLSFDLATVQFIVPER